MLTRLLSIINEADGPMSMDGLSRRLGVERSALTPMLDLLVRKGLLREWGEATTDVVCGSGACGTACFGVQGCPLAAAAVPFTLEIVAPRG